MHHRTSGPVGGRTTAKGPAPSARRPVRRAAAVALAVLLPATFGGAGAGAGASAEVLLGAEVELGGTIAGTGSYSGAVAPAASFRPTSRGTNAAGPFQVTLYLDAVPADDPDVLLEVSVVLLLPGDVAPGTHAIGSLRGPSSGPRVGATVRAFSYAGRDHPDFDEDVEGTLTVTETGAHLSGTFAFGAGDAAGRLVTVSGIIDGLPFEPRPEFQVALSGAVEGRSTSGISAAHHRDAGAYAVVFGLGSDREIVLRFASSLEPGAYELTHGDGSELPTGAVATAGIAGRTADGLRGTLTLAVVAPWLGGAFAFDMETPDGTIAVEGEFAFIVPFVVD